MPSPSCLVKKYLKVFSMSFPQSHLPFAVVGSTDEVKIGNKMVRARQYPWGTVQGKPGSHRAQEMRERSLSSDRSSWTLPIPQSPIFPLGLKHCCRLTDTQLHNRMEVQRPRWHLNVHLENVMSLKSKLVCKAEDGDASGMDTAVLMLVFFTLKSYSCCIIWKSISG